MERIRKSVLMNRGITWHTGEPSPIHQNQFEIHEPYPDFKRKVEKQNQQAIIVRYKMLSETSDETWQNLETMHKAGEPYPQELDLQTKDSKI